MTTISSTIEAANTAPPVPAGTLEVPETTSINTVLLTLPATDDDDDPITYTFRGGSDVSAGGQFKIVGNTIMVNSSLSVPTDFTFTLPIVASDGTEAVEGVVTIVVKDVNVPPETPVYDGSTVIDETVESGAVLGELWAYDEEGDTTTFIFQDAMPGSSGTISADGAFIIIGNTVRVRDTSLIQVTPEEGHRTFIHTVLSTDGGSNSAQGVTLAITVNHVNKAPIAVSGSYEVVEENAPGLLVTKLADTDADGQPVTYTFKSSQEGSGGLVSADGRFKIVGSEIQINAETSVATDETVGYVIVGNDGSGVPSGIVEGTVTIAVKNVNKLPSTPAFTAAAASFDETELEGAAVGTLAATDPDGTVPTFVFADSGTAFSADGALKIENGSVVVIDSSKLEVTPADAQKTFRYLVYSWDDLARSTVGTEVAITVNHVNKSPVVPSATREIAEEVAPDTPVMSLAATDADGQTVAYTFKTFQEGSDGLVSADGRFRIEGNQILVNAETSVAADDGADYVIVANDGSGVASGVVEGAVRITVTNVNKLPTAPVFTAAAARLAETAFASDAAGTLTSTDPDGTIPTFVFADSGTAFSADGAFKIENGSIVVNDPTKIQVTTGNQKTFTYTVHSWDGVAQSATGTVVAITVDNVNKAPAAPGGTAAVAETVAAGAEVLTLGSATDDDGQTLIYTFEGGGTTSADGRFKIVGNKILVNDQAALSVVGDMPFTYSVVADDGSNLADATAAGIVTITVKNVNAAPKDLAFSGLSVVSEDAAVNTTIGTFSASDDGDAVAYSLSDSAGGLFAIDAKTGQLTVAGDLNYERASSHQITVRVSDGAQSLEKIFTITVGDQLFSTKTGKSKNDKINGSAFDDVLKGGKGNDTLKGQDGDDRLYGEDGNDLLYGGAGHDTFVFATKLNKARNLDTIKDFNVADDTIWLDNKIFKKLGAAGSEAAPAALAKDFFVVGKKAKDKNDYLVYDNKKGVLSYDVDGSGKKKAVEIAKINKKLLLTSDDFFIV